jgi:replicative DNA helicase
MITDSFLNLCCRILCDSNESYTKDVVHDIYTILQTYDNKRETIPIQSVSKYELALSLSDIRNNGKDIIEALDDIHLVAPADMMSYVQGLIGPETDIPENKIEASVKQIGERKSLNIVVESIEPLEEFLDKYNTNAFSGTNDIIHEYDSMISKMYSSTNDQKRNDTYNTIRTLDLLSDDYTPVLNQIELSYSGKNSITTGYSELDQYMNGGFEPSRLYIFGGASGDGKSVLLMNLARNAVEREKDLSGKREIFIYITLENLIDESLMRVFCAHNKITIGDVVKDYDNQRTIIEDDLKLWQNNNNAALIMAYFPPTITSVNDIRAFIEDVEAKYADDNVEVKAIYIDYLDLLMAGQKFDLHRLEMGQITIDLKVLSVQISKPIITLTQLNRSIFIKSRINIKGVGDTTFNTVKVGDLIEGKDNEWRTVKKVYPHERKKCYKITTKSGKSIICGPKHNFPTTDGLKNIQYTGLKIGDKLYTQ